MRKRHRHPVSGEFIANVSYANAVQKNEGTNVADFSWTDETGKKISFADFSKDNVVLINFWATWCGPCKRELPDLVALRDEYKDKNIKILGISSTATAMCLTSFTRLQCRRISHIRLLSTTEISRKRLAVFEAFRRRSL